MVASHDYKKNSNYYKSTLEKLINKLFIKEEDDEQQGEDPDFNKQNPNLMSHKNAVLEKVKKEFVLRGHY